MVMKPVPRMFSYSELVKLITDQAPDKQLMCLVQWGWTSSQEEAARLLKLRHRISLISRSAFHNWRIERFMPKGRRIGKCAGRLHSWPNTRRQPTAYSIRSCVAPASAAAHSQH
jgi:hypothetical protein